MGHSVRSLAVTSSLWDKEALAFELDVQKKRHYRHRSALFVIDNARQKFVVDDSDGESDDTASEYDLTMNFSGLDFQEVRRSIYVASNHLLSNLISRISNIENQESLCRRLHCAGSAIFQRHREDRIVDYQYRDCGIRH